MKLRVLVFLFAMVLGGSLFSCSDDDDVYVDRREEEHKVKLVVHSNTPDASVRVFGVDGNNFLYIKGDWEKEFLTKAYSFNIDIKCEDKKALVSAELYLDGKLRNKVEGNGSIVIGIDQVKQDNKK